jgi:hypothetical protein
MNIKKLKKMSGDVSLLEPLMITALFVMFVIIAVTYYNASTKRFNPDFMDIVSFANNLNSLQSDKEVITLKYNEITPFQKDLFSKIDCVNSICKPIDLQKYPTNTYLRIYYKDSKFDSFYLYSKNDSSIFKFNNTPYNEWISERSYDTFQQEQVKLIEREQKSNKDMNPSIVELTTMFDNVSIYNIQDSNRAILFDSSCPETTCTSVLEYKNKPVNPQLADNKKAL